MQELYLWDSVADAGRRALKMRYRLLPHLYTAFHDANKQGSPVAKPLCFAFPHDAATHGIDDQWLFGDVLITPILDQVSTASAVGAVILRDFYALCFAPAFVWSAMHMHSSSTVSGQLVLGAFTSHCLSYRHHCCFTQAATLQAQGTRTRRLTFKQLVFVQGTTKREGYFPKGKWYNLFDNTTIDSHDGGKSVTLDLPMGHVGAHMRGGTILPMQQPALVTADVAASPLTLVVALPHMEPLAHFGHAVTAQDKAEPGSAKDTMTSAQQQGRVEISQNLSSLAGSKKLMASMPIEPQMVQPALRQEVTAGSKCGISEPGRVTACGRVFADNGHQLQVSCLCPDACGALFAWAYQSLPAFVFRQCCIWHKLGMHTLQVIWLCQLFNLKQLADKGL